MKKYFSIFLFFVIPKLVFALKIDTSDKIIFKTIFEIDFSNLIKKGIAENRIKCICTSDNVGENLYFYALDKNLLITYNVKEKKIIQEQQIIIDSFTSITPFIVSSSKEVYCLAKNQKE